MRARTRRKSRKATLPWPSSICSTIQRVVANTRAGPVAVGLAKLSGRRVQRLSPRAVGPTAPVAVAVVRRAFARAGHHVQVVVFHRRVRAGAVRLHGGQPPVAVLHVVPAHVHARRLRDAAAEHGRRGRSLREPGRRRRRLRIRLLVAHHVRPDLNGRPVPHVWVHSVWIMVIAWV